MDEPVLELSYDDTMHERLRTAAAVSPTAVEASSGALVVLAHDEIERLADDPAVTGVGLTFFDLVGVDDGPLRRWFGSILFTSDGPAHQRLRRVTARALTPDALCGHRAFASGLVRQRLTEFVETGVADLGALFGDVPIRVMCRMLGVPDEETSDVMWHAAALSPVFGIMDPRQVQVASTAIDDFLASVERLVRQRHDGGDDLIGAMTRGTGDDRFTLDEVVDVIANLLVGGHDSTASQIGCTLLTALRHPRLLREVRDGSATLSQAVDETIRFEPSLPIVARRLLEPREIGGVVRPEGTVVLLLVAAANRDACWGDPDVVRPSRFADPTVPKVMSFGVSPHLCLGAVLARMTIEEVLAGYAQIADRLTPIGDPGEVVWRSVLGRSPATVLVSAR